MRFPWRQLFFTDRTTPDPDGKWTNISREVERNHLYKWLQRKKPGSLIEIYEQEGREGVLRFASEKILAMLHNDGAEAELVREVDYIKWRKFMQTNLSENAERDDRDQEVMKEIQFQEHVALWKLNRRGVKGETLLHLLLANNDAKCTEIARILLHEYPKLALDIYEDEEMYGQSALHLAILHGDYPTVNLLLRCGAAATQRATGRFFWPRQNRGKYDNQLRMADSDGLAYFGEYPLAFAASFGNKDIYDAIVDRGGDPNAQDSFGNTVLHMCVIHNSIEMYTYAVRHSNKPADVNVVNAIGCTPLALATKLGRKEIFEEMLELSGMEFWRFSDITVSAYPLAALDTINADGTTNWDSALMTIIKGKTPNHVEMVQSDVVQRLLADKWSNFGWKHLYIWGALLILYLIFLSTAIYLHPADEQIWDYSGFYGICRAIVETCTVAGSLFFIFYNSFAEIMMQSFARYITALLSSLDQLMFLIENMLVIACIPCRLMGKFELEQILLVIIAPGSWLMLLFFARASILTGPFVHIIHSMITGDMMRFSLLSGLFLLSFALAFNLLGQNMLELQDLNYCSVGDRKSSYDTYGETVLTLFRAAFGGYEYELLECSHYSQLMKILFIIYLMIMPIMLINMLLAMMGNTYTTIIMQAEKAWRYQLAEMVIRLERYYNKERLAKFQVNYSVNMGVDRDNGLEKRGLMVIKQLKKTKAQQRKQAVYNWRRLFRLFVDIYRERGTDGARQEIWQDTWTVQMDPKHHPTSMGSRQPSMYIREEKLTTPISNHVGNWNRSTSVDLDGQTPKLMPASPTTTTKATPMLAVKPRSTSLAELAVTKAMQDNKEKGKQTNQSSVSRKWSFLLSIPTQSQLAAAEIKARMSHNRGRSGPSMPDAVNLFPMIRRRGSSYVRSFFNRRQSNSVQLKPVPSVSNLPV